MNPRDFRKIRSLERASLYAKQALDMIREAYMEDPNMDRRCKLDEAMVALQKYEDLAHTSLNKAYEQMMKDQT